MRKIIKKLPWHKILKDVFYNHKKDTIIFEMKDIESLSKYVEDLRSRMDSDKIVIEQKEQEIQRLKNLLLAEALKPKTEHISNFIEYA